MYQITKLSNGIQVVTAEMPHMASVSVGIWVGVGGRFEPAEWNGVSHFIEHVLFKGTRKRSAREISQAIEGIGGYLNAFTTEESTCFFARACHDRLDQLLEVLLDMFLDSQFAPAEVDKEREVIKEEYASYLDQPHQHVQELLNEVLWPGQALGRPLTGTPESLDRMGRKDLIRFFQSHYVAQNTYVIAAGNLTHRRLLRHLKPLLGRFRSGPVPRFTPVQERQEGPRIRLLTKPVEQSQLAIGIRTPSRHDEARYPLRILNTLLGENMSSRLFQSIREEAALAYSIATSLVLFEDTGLLQIAGGLDTAQLGKGIQLILRELRQLADKGPTLREVREARDYLLGQMDLQLENTESHMMWVGDQLLGYGRLIEAEEIRRRLRRVTPAQVRHVSRRIFRPDNMSFALISPIRKAKGLLPRTLP